MTISDDHLIRMGRTLAGAAIVMSVGGLAVAIAARRWDLAWFTLTPVNATVGMGFGALAWTVLPRQPRNGSVWAYAVAAFLGGLYSACLGVLVLTAPDALLIESMDPSWAPAEMSAVPAVAVGVMGSIWIGSLFLPLTLGLALFPDGRPASPRWRWLSWYSATTITVAILSSLVLYHRWSAVPVTTYDGPLGAFVEAWQILAQVGALFAVASLVARYRKGDATVRRQIRSIAMGGAVLVVGELGALLFKTVVSPDIDPSVDNLGALVPLFLLIGSFWMGITRYRLYEIDAIISKSVTYLGLATVISLLYAVIVVVPLLIVGIPDEGGPGLVLPIAATAVVAVLFEPIRARTERWADRLVYGNRSTPHEVLSQLTARLSETGTDGGTADLARLLAQGTGADRAVVWLLDGDELVPEAAWPTDDPAILDGVAGGELVDDEYAASQAVRHGDERLGALTITKPHNDPITPADRELLDDVAAGAGLLLRNIRLNRELEARARQVRESRRRLITAQDAERHRLERDLHDGAQQQVVALKVKLGIAKVIAQREGADDIAAMVDGLSASTQDAVDALRAVAHGIYPPLLEAEGLPTALNAVARTSAIPLRIDSTEVGRYTRQVEETIYFCVLETLHAAHMAGATSLTIHLADDGGELVLAFEHDAPEADLTDAVDRIDAYGGTSATTHPDRTSTVTTCRVPTDHTLEPA